MVRSKVDFPLLFLILGIGSISLLVIFSINKTLATNQLIFWLAGLTILVLFSFFDFRNWQKFALVFYLGTLFALFFLLIFGDPIRGSVRWIDLGFFRFQPSEIAKVAAIMLLSTFYVDNPAAELKNLFVGFLLVLPAVILVLVQPDVGNALTFVAIWFGLSLVSGVRLRHIITALLIMVVSFALVFKILAPYQKERLKTFFDPTADPLRAGYQIIQSKIAIGSGKFIGRGLGLGSQSQLNFLPEAESDFIFASTSEQLGFLGAATLIILYILFIFRILRLTRNADHFGQLLIIGSSAYLIVQFIINVSMNMGMVPVTGITLPLVSYGGSSLTATLFLLGIIFSIRRFTVEP